MATVSLPTIKILFAGASRCAFPLCEAPLVFRDRGLDTVNADIAHIRSKSSRGPRHQAAFDGNLDGPENLLLLCGIHHRPIDRHESAYTVEELLRWKSAQLRTGDGGTPVDEEELRSLFVITDQDRESLKQVARLTRRYERKCEDAEAVMADLYAARDTGLNRQTAGVIELVETGERLRPSPPRRLVEEWDSKIDELCATQRPDLVEAAGSIEEEVAAVAMVLPVVEAAGGSLLEIVVQMAHEALRGSIGEQTVVDLRVASQAMWRVANGQE